MRIDSHQHFWRYDPQRHNWITDAMSVLKQDFMPEDLLPQVKSHGIDGCVTVQVDQTEDETLFLFELADQHPEIKGVVGWVDLRATNLPERLEYFSKFPKLRGFRHIVQSEPDHNFMLKPEFMRGISALGKFGYTYDILIYPHQLPAVLEMASVFSAQRFVIDHIAKPQIREKQLSGWAKLMRLAAQNPNVYCKVSGMITEADWSRWQPADFEPYLDVVFEAFGCDRLMFGSDWPVCLLAGDYGKVKSLVENYISRFSAEQQDKIFGQNAVAFYDLKS